MTVSRVERRLAAVLAADIAGYSRLMGADELGTLEALKAHRRDVIDPAIASHKGRVVKTTGDGMLAEFASALEAVTCAMAIQDKMAERNGSWTPKINFRIGINVGDIIIESDDIFGDGVNLAARVENECEPGAVCLSGSAFEQVRGKTGFSFKDLGERFLKNIDHPVSLYASQKAALSQVPLESPSEGARRLPLPDKPSLAVLPFTNMSGDPEQEYFADGITEDIITELSKWRWFFVIARNSSFKYKGHAVDVKRVGLELGVRYLLEGSIRKVANRIRLTAQLIDTVNGVHIWAERYDRELVDVFVLQDELTQQVAAAIEPALSKVETEQARHKTPGQMAAWDHFLRGMWHYHQFKEKEVANALACFQRATELDGLFADAYAAAARALNSRIMYHGPADRESELAKVIQLAKKALSIDSENLNAHYILSIVYSHQTDAEAGWRFAQRANELNGNFAPGYFAMALACLYLGRPEEALYAIDRALRLSPTDPQTFTWRATRASALFLLNRHREAIESARQSLDVKWYHTAVRILAAGYAELGMTEDACRAVRELLSSEHAEKPIAAVRRPFLGALDGEKWTLSLRNAGMPDA